MKWLQTILEEAVITNGKLNMIDVMKSIRSEFPRHAVPKTNFNEKLKALSEANKTIEKLKKENMAHKMLQNEITAYKTKIKNLEKQAADGIIIRHRTGAIEIKMKGDF